MRRLSLVVLSLLSAAALTFGFVAPVHADALDAGISVPVGSGLAPAPIAVVVLPPATALPDPLEHPLDALTDTRLAVRTNWPLAVFMVLVMITKGLAYASARGQSLPIVGGLAKWLSAGKHAMAVAAAGTLAAAAYNTLVTGGTVVAALTAAGLALVGLMHSTTQPKAAA